MRFGLPDIKQAAASMAAVLSVAGPELCEAEAAFFRSARPLGFILFARNCKTADQLSKLTAALRETVGWDCPVLIDQEGGRVQRLKPPVWRAYPPMRQFGERAESDLEGALSDLRYTILQLAEELVACGIDVNCAPVLDVLTPRTHEAIGDRAFSSDPALVARLGLCVARNMLAAGVTPVIKHVPGHGRATLDSHHALPVVDAPLSELQVSDFKPFFDLSRSDIAPALWGMAAHILYPHIDPDHPSSVSEVVIRDVIRGSIGFEGLLLSDDLDMNALAAYGDVPARCLASLKAGCDVALYCAGELKVMERIAETVPNLSEKAQKRLQNAAEFRTVRPSSAAVV